MDSLPKDARPLTFIKFTKTSALSQQKKFFARCARKQMAKYLAFDHGDIKFNFEGEPVEINIFKFWYENVSAMPFLAKIGLYGTQCTGLKCTN